jgi:5-methylcytosine-specific restriction endonuclease McrA
MPYTDPEQQREYQRRWRANRRTRWINENGGRCQECGSTDRLEIDHVDPSEKEYSPTFAWSRADREQELRKCQILCKSCHAKKTYALTTARHGTALAYNRDHCRCEQCKTWNRERVRAQRAAQYSRFAPPRGSS